jgi:hypothetical protein
MPRNKTVTTAPAKQDFDSNLFSQKSLQDSFNKLKWRKPGHGDPTPSKTGKQIHFVKALKPQDLYVRDHDIHLNDEFELTDTPVADEENGKMFFHAAVRDEDTDKYQSFKVFVLDKFPEKFNFENTHVLSSEMQDYQWKAKKSGGQSNSGQYGGQYQFRFILREDIEPDKFPKSESTYAQTVLFKQEASADKIHNDKNITEYVASRLMNLFAGDSSATVFLASSNLFKKLPDPSGDNIFVGSIYMNNYQDLFRDIERIHGRIPDTDMTRPRAVGSLNKSWFTHGLVDPITKECRFQNFETVFAISLLLKEFDAHSANFGVIANRDHDNPDDNMAFKHSIATNDPLLDEERKERKLGKLVKIDNAGALENLEDEVNMDVFRFWVSLTGNSAFNTQPTNHLREYPRHLRVSPKMVAELERLSQFDLSKVKDEIDDIFKELTKFYGVTPLLQFGERMGADVKAHLLSVFGDEDIYQSIRGGKFLDKESSEITPEVVNCLKQFLLTKMTNRLASTLQLAVDMKVSLCFKMVNGVHMLDPDSPYHLKEILSQHPDYITNDKFHFRAPGQKSIIQSLMGNNNLKDLALKASSDAAIEVLRDSLGNKIIAGNTSNYSVTFYKTEQNGRINSPIPLGVQHLVVTESAFKQSVYKKEKSPTIVTQVAANTDIGLKPGEYGLNFVDSIKAGDKGLFIEKYSANSKYQISAHRLPPEINPRYIYAEVILKRIKQDLLSADPSIAKKVQSLTAKMYSVAGEVKFDKLSADQVQYVMKLLELNDMGTTELDQITKAMAAAEYAATTQPFKFDGVDYKIPSAAYLDYAEKQCELMIKRSGPNTIIQIMPDLTLTGQACNVRDPLLTQAYMLVCHKNNWKFENKTNVQPFTQQFLSCSTEHLRNDNLTNTSAMSIPIK